MQMVVNSDNSFERPGSKFWPKGGRGKERKWHYNSQRRAGAGAEKRNSASTRLVLTKEKGPNEIIAMVYIFLLD
jgi:hypothetical protein